MLRSIAAARTAAAASAILLLAQSAHALTLAEVCSFRGKFVESFAHSRDAGKTQQHTLAAAKRELGKRGWPAASIQTYVAMPWQYPEFPPSTLRKVVEQSCLQQN
jgi:hypothetical protein